MKVKENKQLVFNKGFISVQPISEEVDYFLSNLPDYYETANPLILTKAFTQGYEIRFVNNDTKVKAKNMTPDDIKLILTELEYFHKIASHSITELFLTDFIMTRNGEFAQGYKYKGRKILREVKEQIDELLLCDTK